MDPLSEVLSLLKPRSYTAGGLDLGGEWSVRWGSYDGIKCYALVSGQCWLAMEGVADPVLVTAGDCFLLASGRPFRLASDLSLPSVQAPSGFQVSPNGTVASYNGGGTCYGLGGHFALDGDASILLGVLPPIVHLSAESDRAAMRWSLERMMYELRDPQPGGSLVAQQLAYMMLVQALRLHLAKGANGQVGWLFALADPHISKAVTCIHSHPGHRWTLQELAEHAGISRSGFALRFKQVVGLSPMDYLTRWRLLIAGDRLANSADSLAAIAASVGYDSESAFSVAFKRVMGVSPRQFSRGDSPRPFSHNGEQSNRVDALQLSMG
jgi:AraC-like DNA-binding protein